MDRSRSLAFAHSGALRAPGYQAELHCFVLGFVESLGTVHPVPEAPSGTCVLLITHGTSWYLTGSWECTLAACHAQLTALC